MKRVVIAGVGLIGGSFALALRRAGFSGEILGIGSQRTIESALARGAINAATTFEEAAATADLIYLAQPIPQIFLAIERLGPIARAGCIITDAGSTKRQIVEHASKYVRSATFVGGHPMAGKESRGVENAESTLFEGKPYVFIGEPPTELRYWVERIGADIVIMPAKEHDETVALTSHLPQLLSTALAATLAESATTPRVFGPGLLDMTRLALGGPEIWSGILESNKDAVLSAMAKFRRTLDEVEARVKESEVEDLFLKGNKFSRKIRG